MGPDGLRLTLAFDTSRGEQVAGWAKGAGGVERVQHHRLQHRGDLAGYGVTPIMFVADDDAARKPAVLGSECDFGFEALDTGLPRNARLHEP